MTQQLESVQEQLRQKDGQLSEATQQLTNVQGQLSELTQQLTNTQRQLQRKDEQNTSLEEQLTAKEQEVNELEISLATTQRALIERPRQQSPDWIIPRDQIQLTEKFLGKGGWGSVFEGKYCGCTVAVKEIYEDLLNVSSHNRELLEREMNIASKCRHPCLLQFIGATNDERSALFVTELMEKSLRKLLEQRSLSTAEVVVISLDVARALNYLHQKSHAPLSTVISVAPMCCYGDKLTEGEAKCRIMVLLILCSIPCQFVQVLQYTVLLKHLLKIKL